MKRTGWQCRGTGTLTGNVKALTTNSSTKELLIHNGIIDKYVTIIVE
jgi:hypothetical protein